MDEIQRDLRFNARTTNDAGAMKAAHSPRFAACAQTYVAGRIRASRPAIRLACMSRKRRNW